MRTARILAPVLNGQHGDMRKPLLDTLVEMDQQINRLRARKVGAAVVESKTVNALQLLVKRARGQASRMA